MFDLKIKFRWLIMFVVLLLILGSIYTVLKGYHETLYYCSGTGIWKMNLLTRKALLLTNMQASPALGLSPDQKWLTYYHSTTYGNYQPLDSSLWVISTEGGDPIQVSKYVTMVHHIGWEGEWLRYVEMSNFKVDPQTGYAVAEHQVAYRFNPYTQERRSELPQISTSKDSEGCLQLTFSPANDNEVLEKCINPDGTRTLRVVEVSERNAITISLIYKDGATSWSHNGKWLAIEGKDIYGLSQVFVWGRRNSEILQITGKTSQEEHVLSSPQWSPNSRWLAFQTRSSDLCVFDVRKNELECFEEYITHYGDAMTWRNNNQALIIASNRLGKLMSDTRQTTDLFAISIPEGNITRLTNNPDVEFWPILSR